MPRCCAVVSRESSPDMKPAPLICTGRRQTVSGAMDTARCFEESWPTHHSPIAATAQRNAHARQTLNVTGIVLNAAGQSAIEIRAGVGGAQPCLPCLLCPCSVSLDVVCLIGTQCAVASTSDVAATSISIRGQWRAGRRCRRVAATRVGAGGQEDGMRGRRCCGISDNLMIIAGGGRRGSERTRFVGSCQQAERRKKQWRRRPHRESWNFRWRRKRESFCDLISTLR